MRALLFTVLLGSIASSAMAQNASATASQTIQLALNPVIDLRFTNTGTGTGSTVNMAFSNVSQYVNGVNSGTQELEVRSNKNFKISVQTDAPTFTYTGSGSSANSLPVNNTLFLEVASNSTGGSVASGFDNYTSLSSSSQDVLLNGSQGAGKKLVLAYRAKPDMGYPAGTYSVGVVYTATQP